MLKGKLKVSYKALRSILFSAIIIVGILFGSLYVLLSLPFVQNFIGKTAEEELTSFLGGEVRIGDVSIFPFNEVVLSDVSLSTPQGEECISVGRLGAGINLWTLLVNRKIEITYAEIIELDAHINKPAPDSPLNIQFLIDAFSPKDKNKPPAKFDLKIHNIVIRRSRLCYDNLYVEKSAPMGRFDSNHIRIEKLNADVLIPRLSNEDMEFDVRRISLMLNPDLQLTELSFKAKLTEHQLDLVNFYIQFPHSGFHLNDQHLSFLERGKILESLKNSSRKIEIKNGIILPADFGCFFEPLRKFTTPWRFDIIANGDGNQIDFEKFSLVNQSEKFSLSASIFADGLMNKQEVVSIENLDLRFRSEFVKKIFTLVVKKRPSFLETIGEMGEVIMAGNVMADIPKGEGKGNLSVESNVGVLKAGLELHSGSMRKNPIKDCSVKGDINLTGFLLDRFVEKSPVSNISLDGEYDLTIHDKEIIGTGNVDISTMTLRNKVITNLHAEVFKDGRIVGGKVECDDADLNLNIETEAKLAGADSRLSLVAYLNKLDLSLFNPFGKYASYVVTGNIFADVEGNSVDNMTGQVSLADVSMVNSIKELRLDNLDLSVFKNKTDEESKSRHVDVKSDWFDLTADIDIPIKELKPRILTLLNESLPVTRQFISHISDDYSMNNDNVACGGLDAKILLKPCEEPYQFFNISFVPLIDSELNLKLGEDCSNIVFYANLPFIRQGKNKLIQETELKGMLSSDKPNGTVTLHTLYPAKKGDVEIDVTMKGEDDDINTLIEFNKNKKGAFFGELNLDSDISKSTETGKEKFRLIINPSSFNLNGAEWAVAPAEINYSDKLLTIDNLHISHDDQFVDIRGIGSASKDDVLTVSMADIDLNYIFDTLNINYVSFGGIATGTVEARGLFSESPDLATRSLNVKNLSYNYGVLGDGELKSSFDIKEKKVLIRADISDGRRKKAVVDGGIWITRDSLAFDMTADKVDVAFLKPFMSAFSSEVSGKASGNAKLYGTFSDIDLVGKLFADTISMKVDYTNVTYTGSDSVIMVPGKIIIPSIRLYDRNGKSGILSGEVRHRYFHEPEFEFSLRDADGLLCYDTDALMNNIWYGTVYGTGSGHLRGDDSLVAIDVDMTTEKGTDFTFVLSDMQEADEYKFLTFTDKRKEKLLEEAKSEEPDFLSIFRKKIEANDSGETEIAMDLRASITPASTLNIIMDPVSGDRIRANGSGSMQMEYNSTSDEFKMYGKYTLDQGHYNFSLQDIILKDFSIRPGSVISFNGDPMNGILDIAATYRVNTNLSDLDKSFSTDRDLNRTNVPVDAVLMVNGPMTSPSISFDIDLPTLTDEVERKVKSIISTDDQMSRQIIYLLALNRFYTPEYMGGTSNGGEWASVASSTISSQLSNMLGQLTDKVSVMPSIRSDKGDFSDMEVDLALSSKLLNNRLLLNGNFGYRDKSTSTTTFIGDFDIEYILTNNGTLRLKAYNHFNDENYYLKSALTTQGVGIVVRKDFDSFSLKNLFRRRKKDTTEVESEEEVMTEEKVLK